MPKQDLPPVLKAAMRTHRDLMSILMELREDQVKQMLDCELSGPFPRPSVVERLHQRFTILRAAREREEMLGDLVNVRGVRVPERSEMT